MADRHALRIAMISYYLPSGSKIGVGHQVDALAREMVRRGHSVDVYSDCPPVEGAPYTVRQIPSSGSLRTFYFALALRRVDFSAYDVLHAHGDDYWLWRRRAAAHVRTLHGSCFEEALRIRGAKERIRMLVLGLSEVLASIVADETTLVSPATRRWTPWVKVVVPNGVDQRKFRPSPTNRSVVPTVLFVGTWFGRKRGADLAEVFVNEVLPHLPSAQVRMVARDVPADASPRLVVLGALTDDELVREYQEAWVFCLPSSYEGFGVPYIEAMASGLPVVATPNVGARYVTDGGRYGVLTPLEGLGRALRDVLSSDESREQLGVAGIERASEFSLESVAQKYEDIYARLLERHSVGVARPAEARRRFGTPRSKRTLRSERP